MFRKSRVKNVHFIGIGGVGMSGLAEVLINLGYKVSGSDIKPSETIRRLERMKAKISYIHAAENIKEVDVVVVSSAIRGRNPEIQAAEERGIPIIPRAEMLAELMRLKYGVAIAGSHGKTTTTSMIATILARAGLDPTMVIGGRLNSLGSGARLGSGEFLVAEADESDESFLRLSPIIAVVTNIAAEHLDHYLSMDSLKNAFIKFVNKVPFYGLSVLCLDSPEIQEIIPRIERRFCTYGFSAASEYRALDLEVKGFYTVFKVIRKNQKIGEIKIRMPGRHVALNSLAAIAVADELGIPFKETKEALSNFEGIYRRFTLVGEVKDVLIVDDYAHHPEEIKATLEAAHLGFNRRLKIVFQPHRFTRLKNLWHEFETSFYLADEVYVLPVYGAGEEDIEGVDSEKLAFGMRAHGHRGVIYAKTKKEAVDLLLQRVRAKDMVLTLGAGDVGLVAEEFKRRLEKR
jgi:UDP-N-acetylmuramate--alanine ligase